MFEEIKSVMGFFGVMFFFYHLEAEFSKHLNTRVVIVLSP